MFYGNFSDTWRKSTKGLLRGYRVYPEPWEAAVGQELVNENLGTPQTGTHILYIWPKRLSDTYRREKGVTCLLTIPKKTVPRLQVAV